MHHQITKWRKNALKMVDANSGATETQRALAWRFLKQWGVK